MVAGGAAARVLNLVQGGRETGMALAQHPAIDGLYLPAALRLGSASISNLPASRRRYWRWKWAATTR